MFTSNKKLTGIIYKAYNKESKKSYIGQSVRPLKTRIQEHYRKATKIRHKFANALIAYEKSVWEWSVLKEVPIEELDYYEKFFIDDLDTYNAGYNSLNGNSWENRKFIPYDRKIIELYHKDYGLFSGYQFEILRIEPRLDSVLYKLLKGKSLSRHGWVLAENKDSYDEIMGVYEFYHPEIGVVKCTTGELDRDYIRPTLSGFRKDVTHIQLSVRLVLKHNPRRTCYGWILLKNKEEGSLKITLCHKIHGQHSLSKEEFIEKFELVREGLNRLLSKKTVKHRGWKLIEEKK